MRGGEVHRVDNNTAASVADVRCFGQDGWNGVDCCADVCTSTVSPCPAAVAVLGTMLVMPSLNGYMIVRVFCVALLLVGCAVTHQSAQPRPEGRSVPAPESTAAASREVMSTLQRKAELTMVVERDGTPAAVALLKEWMRTDMNVAAECHSLSRHIGLIAAAHDGLTVPLEDWCEYGFLHGVLLGTAAQAPSLAAFADTAKKYCATMPRNDDEVSRCFHGVGHGFAVASHNDIAAALDACAALHVAGSEQCFGAVLMEFGEDVLAASGWALGHSAENSPQVLTVSPDKVDGLCTNRPLTCFYRLWMFHVPPRAAVSPDSDATFSVEVCVAPMSAAEQRACREGFGEFAGALWTLFDIGPTRQWPPDTAAEAAEDARTAVARCATHPEPTACIFGLIPSTTSNLYTAKWPFIPDFCAVAPKSWAHDCARAVYSAQTGGQLPPE